MTTGIKITPLTSLLCGLISFSFLILVIITPLQVQAAVIADYGMECCILSPYDACCPEDPLSEVVECIDRPCGPTTEDQNGTCQRVCIDETGQPVTCEEGGEIQCVNNSEGESAAAGTTTNESYKASKKKVSTPDLTVSIPGLTLAGTRTVTDKDGLHQMVEIPWMADYIVAVYRYTVFLGSILAAVMMMIGGLQWLTAGGNAGQIGAAKTRITDALTGLLLLLGSYLILTTINPDLTQLNPLRVPKVVGNPYDVKQVLQTTTENTGGELEMP